LSCSNYRSSVSMHNPENVGLLGNLWTEDKQTIKIKLVVFFFAFGH
jgi:hypothetical protein